MNFFDRLFHSNDYDHRGGSSKFKGISLIVALVAILLGIIIAPLVGIDLGGIFAISPMQIIVGIGLLAGLVLIVVIGSLFSRK